MPIFDARTQAALRLTEVEKEVMVIDDYTHYAFDEEADLDRVPYWIFSAAHTAPGHPRKAARLGPGDRP